MERRHLDWERKVVSASNLVIRSKLPPWIIAALRQGGIKRLDIVSKLSDAQLLEIPGIGRRAVALIREEIRRLSATRDEATKTAPRSTPD